RLALAPYWTVRLAEACGLAPGRTAAALARARERGALESADPLPGPDGAEDVYRMTGAARADVLDESLASADGPARVRRLAADLGREIRTRARSLAVPSSTERWATLAVHALQSQGMVAAFEERIPSGRDANPAEVLNWIEDARPLAALLARDADPAMERALERAGRRGDFLHRPPYDDARPRSFLRIPAPGEALSRL